MNAFATLVGIALVAVAAGIATAQSNAPYRSGNPEIGAKLVQKDCAACHARKFGGDATLIYTRDDRKVRNPEQLLSQVTVCNADLNLQYFPEDEANVAAHLDRDYYRFSRW